MKKKLSIIIPCYNEKDTILKILEKINNVHLKGIEKETIIIDDFSIDGTRKILKSLNDYIIIFNDKNYGKGFSIREGIKNASGDIIIIQDADLEYNPQNYNDLVKPILDNNAQVVYGSRTLGPNSAQHSHLSFLIHAHIIGLSTY